MSINKYHREFQALVKVLDDIGCTIPDQSVIDECRGAAAAQRESHVLAAKEQTMAMLFIANSNKGYNNNWTYSQSMSSCLQNVQHVSW